MSSKNKTKNSDLDQSLGDGTLVAFDHESQIQIGVIINNTGKKIRVLTMRGREMDLPPARLSPIPGKIPSEDGGSLSQSSEYLLHAREHAEKSSLDISPQEIWSFVHEESTPNYTVDELSELYLGENSLESHLSVRLALCRDKIYFKRRGNTFSPRPSETVEELKKTEALQKEREEIAERALEECIRIQNGDEGELHPNTRNIILRLKRLAAGYPHLSNSEVKETLTFLDRYEELCSKKLSGTREERAYQLLTHMGIFHQNTNLTFIRHGLRSSYGEHPVSELDSLQSDRSPARADRTQLEVFTIDDESTRDMDDALSFERVPEGYRVGIHITDIASLIKKDSELDCEARERATSLYFPEMTVNMFPPEIAEERGSLVPGTPRDVISCFVTFTPEHEISEYSLSLSTVISQKKFSYHEVDQLLDPPTGDLGDLYQIAMSYSSLRISRGGMKIPKRMVNITLNKREDLKNTSFTLTPFNEHTPARDLVGEMMILANEICAKYAFENCIPYIFRSQKPQDSDAMDSIQKVPPGPAYDAALRNTLKRSHTGTVPEPHSTLGVDFYGQVTSPIRRYLDLVNQRQLVAAISGDPLPYTEKDIELAIAETSESLQTGRLMNRETHRFWVLKYLEEKARRKETIDATVVRDDGKQYQLELEEVFIPVLLRSNTPLKRGDHVVLTLQRVDPRYDVLKLGLKEKN